VPISFVVNSRDLLYQMAKQAFAVGNLIFLIGIGLIGNKPALFSRSSSRLKRNNDFSFIV